jgi:hypothetical protein
MDVEIYKDTISGLSGHPMSGLWLLQFESGRSVHIESGYGVRQLASCFGATEGSGDLLDKIVGKVVYWSYDEMGLVLGGFTPVDEAGEELIELYESQSGEVNNYDG